MSRPTAATPTTPLRPPDGEAILLAWVAKNARAAPMLTALDRPSALHGRISRLILLSRETADHEDTVALEQTLETLRQTLKDRCPQIDVRRWRTEASPTDHAEIRRFVEGVLTQTRLAHPAAHLYLFLSPGTPAMHAVWLVLGATGFVSGPLTMIQGVPSEVRRPGQAPVEAVSVDVDNWLRRFRDSRPAQTAADDPGDLWDPASLHPHGAMRAALDRLERWKDLQAPVLLVGERGTGKTTLANALRAMSRFQRKDKRGRPENTWPSVVCGQFRSNPQLARGELFGYRKGAFTGADREHVGLLEQADGDSLFLDEIADLDRDTQRLLMAALEGRGFRRLGETEERRSVFRLICATNRPIDRLRGVDLDEDFFDRVSVFVLEVPPLRRCREDLPVIWRQVWRKIATETGAHPEPFVAHPDLLAALHHHPLPGNLRDLQRLAWHLASHALAGEDPQDAVALALRALDPAGAAPTPGDVGLAAELPLARPLLELLREQRDAWTRAALARAGGNQSEAARSLGVKRETFKEWVRELDAPREAT